MTTTQVQFKRGELTNPDAANPLNRRVIAAMIASGQFWRSSRGGILFQPDKQHPDAFVGCARAEELADVLRDAGAVQWVGDPVYEREWRLIAMGANDLRWRLPLADEARYAPARINAASARTVRA